MEIDCGWGCYLECVSCTSRCLGKCVNDGCQNTCSNGSVNSDNAFGCDNDCYIGCSGTCKGGLCGKEKRTAKIPFFKIFLYKRILFLFFRI